jgi:drug/metabolite transporter (DMT)-like permease
LTEATAPPPDPAAPRVPVAVAGMLWMLLATLIAVSMHVIVRRASGVMHPLQVAFFYNLFTMLVLLPLFWRHGPGVLRTRRYGLYFVRAVLHLTSMLLFYYGLTRAPLAVAGALGFLAPLFAVIISAVLFKEGFTLRRWLALAAGFAGMIMIARPDPGAMDVGALYFIGAAAIWGVVLPMIKLLGRTESSSTITAWMVLMMGPLALLPAIPVWTTPDPVSVAWLALAGAAGAGSQLALTHALRTGATNVVMPVDFFRLVWSALFGFIIFHEVPDLWTGLGGATIFIATTWLALREHQLGTAARRAVLAAAAQTNATPTAGR